MKQLLHNQFKSQIKVLRCTVCKTWIHHIYSAQKYKNTIYFLFIYLYFKLPVMSKLRISHWGKSIDGEKHALFIFTTGLITKVVAWFYDHLQAGVRLIYMHKMCHNRPKHTSQRFESSQSSFSLFLKIHPEGFCEFKLTDGEFHVHKLSQPSVNR